MRTYILALTKYGLVATVAVYTILAFVLLLDFHKTPEKVLCRVQSGLILVFQVISYFTLYTAMEDRRFIFFCLAQVVTFGGAIIIYETLYSQAHMPLFNNMCMMLSIGLVILSRLSFDRSWRQYIIALGGLVLAVVIPLARRWFYLLKYPKLMYGLLGVVILAIVMLLGATTLGANITYTIFGLTFQPSEFVKILYILFLASTLRDVKTLSDVFVAGVFAGAHVLILIGSRDLGSGLIFFVIFLFMLYMSTDVWGFLAAGFGAGAIGAIVCYTQFSHIQERVAAFLDPWQYMDTIGWQITQSLFAISAGGAFGSGLGQGTPEKIPFVQSDFIFAALCEEFGLIIGVCVILLCLNCVFHMFLLSMRFADRFYRLLAYGSAVCFGFQAFLTLGGETKFIPLTGVTLPLISYGGSSILSTLLLFTLIQTMYILRGEKIEEMQLMQMQMIRDTEDLD